VSIAPSRKSFSSTARSSSSSSFISVLSTTPYRHFSGQVTATAPSVPAFEASTPRIVVFASNVAVITGDNPYGSIADVFESTWQKSFPDAFAASKARAEEEKGEPIMSANEQLLEDVRALGLSQDFDLAMVTATKADGTTQVIQQARKAFEAKLIDATVTDIDKRNKLLKFTRDRVNKAFGANNEPAFIKDFEFKTNVKVKDNNKKFFKKQFGVTNRTKIPCVLGGRIDGFVDGRLIEVKNRVSRVFNSIPEYENVQFQCYLQLVDLESGDLLQRVKTDLSNTTELSSTIRRDDALFRDTIVPRLQIFCDFMDYFLSSPRFGVEYLLLRRAGQEKFLMEYLQARVSSAQLVGSFDADIIAR
jgi:hypothetical protein